MNCSKPGLPVLHQLPELAQTHCSWSRWCHPTTLYSIIPFSSCLQSFPASGSFPMSQFFASGGQSIGASASASVFPVNFQGWSSLGLTGLISLLSKGLSRVFSSTTAWKRQFLDTQPFLWSNSHIHTHLLAKIKCSTTTLNCILNGYPEDKKVSGPVRAFSSFQDCLIYFMKHVLRFPRTSLAVQWLRFHLPVQELWVPSLVGELTSHMPPGEKPKT